jgi:dihydroneopterin aldolase
MSDKLNLTGIRGFGYHGVFESERKNGQEFVVDVEIETKFKNLNDDLTKTIDYSKLVDLVSTEITSNPVNLIETLAERIAEKIMNFDKKIKALTITVHKPAAPVSANLSDISVTISKTR